MHLPRIANFIYLFLQTRQIGILLEIGRKLGITRQDRHFCTGIKLGNHFFVPDTIKSELTLLPTKKTHKHTNTHTHTRWQQIRRLIIRLNKRQQSTA